MLPTKVRYVGGGLIATYADGSPVHALMPPPGWRASGRGCLSKPYLLNRFIIKCLDSSRSYILAYRLSAFLRRYCRSILSRFGSMQRREATDDRWQEMKRYF